MGINHRPSIYQYTEYRPFCRDMFDYIKFRSQTKLTLRSFAHSAGFKSPSFLKMVMDGERKLPKDKVEQTSRALGLSQSESFALLNLVLLESAKTIDDKFEIIRHLIKSRRNQKTYKLRKNQIEYLSQWYYVAIRELVALPNVSTSAEDIAKRLRPAITKPEAESALNRLVEMGFIIRKGDGTLEQSDRSVSTGDVLANVAVTKFHLEMSKKGTQSLEEFETQHRDVTGVTVGISPETRVLLRRRIAEFRKEILEMAEKDQNPSIVYYVNFQLFPLSDPEGGSGNETGGQS